MQKRIPPIALATAFVLTVLFPPPAAGQTVPAGAADLQARVSSLLERFPADTAEARDALCAEVLGLGPAGLAETLARVKPPGGANDAKARFAANGLAVYVTRAGAEAERLLVVRALLAALSRTPDKDVAAFLITQIQLAGKGESVKPLARYLGNEALAGPAARALQAIGGPEGAKALLKALDHAPLQVQLSIVDTLGAMRSRKAVKTLGGLARHSDPQLRRASRSALANIGDPAAMDVLSGVLVVAPYEERAQAPRDLLLYIRRLIEAGRKTEGLSAARALLASYRRPAESSIAAEALSLIAAGLGKEALPDLLEAAASPDASLRGAALEIAGGIPWDEALLARWIGQAGASRAEVRAAIIEMLGRHGDAAALPYLRESLRDKDKAVRLAAIRAAARLGRETVLVDLFGLLGTADEEEAAALKMEFLRARAESVVPRAVGLIDRTPHPGKGVLIDILGEKGARDEIDRVFALASDAEPATRSAALGALAQLAGERDLPRLAERLESATDADDIIHLQDAVAAAAARGADPARKGAALVDLMNGASPARKAAILRVLPKVGGALSLKAVVAETGGPDPQAQTAAVYALSQWPDFAASGELLRIATTTASKRYRLLAVDGYVRLVGRANMTGPRKLALFQDLLAQAFDDSDKKAVVTGVAAVREPEALRLLAGCLDHPALADTAAAGLLELASEQAPQERWLSGHEAYSVLRRVQARAGDDPAEYARIGALIAARLRQGGFVPLFDGRALDGWKGLVADPPARAKMTPQDLAAAQAAADERMRAHWKVVDGVLVFDGRGESLCTAADYGDFELLVDWKIEKGGDSGLYLRGTPQVQIWDPDANPIGSGGLYNNQKGKSAPAEKADRPVGEWNAFRIIMIGDRVSVYLNDKLVVDNVVLENYWERDKPVYPTGQIELQAHGNPLYFKDVFIREIPRDTPSAGLAPAEVDEGFVPLFNGRDLAGWTGGGGYAAEDGMIVVHPERGGGNLYTEREYSDFVLRFEFKLTPAANNGLGVRAPLEGDAAYVGMELQILEDGSPVYWGLKPYQYHGSIYGVVPARRGVLRPVGEWNTEEVTARGRRITVAVNGAVIVDADIDAAAAGGTMDGRDHPGLARTSGHIGFLGHGSIVQFRNIRIKEMK
jgi:HEAT repeat protein